jgi:hypothetical protein
MDKVYWVIPKISKDVVVSVTHTKIVRLAISLSHLYNNNCTVNN